MKLSWTSFSSIPSPGQALLLAVLLLGLPVLAGTEPGPGHEGISCRQCHNDLGNDLAITSSEHCADCHSRTRSDLAFHMRPGRNCNQCHYFHKPEQHRPVAEVVESREMAPIDRPHCVTCHFQGADAADLSDGHLVAMSLYHAHADELDEQTPAQACLFCHDGANHHPWQDELAEPAFAIRQHSSHPWGVGFRPGQGISASRIKDEIDPTLILPQDKIDCITCHQLTAQTDDLLVVRPGRSGLCLGCHDLQPGNGKDQAPDQFLATMTRR